MRPPDPVGDLTRFTERIARQRGEPDLDRLAQLRSLVADVRLAALADAALRPAALSALLDLSIATPQGAGAPRGSSMPPPAEPGSVLAAVREQGREGLRSLLLGAQGRETAAWLASAVLARRESEALSRRIAAAQALEGLYQPPTRLALFACAIEPDAELRLASQRALLGWPDEGVHRFFMDQARRGRGELFWIEPRLVREHFARVQLPKGSPLAAELAVSLQSALRGDDWREAYHAIGGSRGLPDGLVVPILIEALADWQARRESGKGRLRLEGDLVAELKRRSGRNIGAYPERWATWWRSREAGKASDAEGNSPAAPGTAAGFFGLRPMTDRVVFVLDRSGSMQATFRAGNRSRYEEAIVQLMGLLKTLGPATHFRVIQFSSGNRVWSEDLEPATPGNLTSIEAWMRYRPPEGATNLEPAIREALRLDSRGRVDLTQLEADTVIVLCDGETAEGPGWVEALLAGPNELAGMVFHCVQIGGGSDGTLERLAQGTGGEYVAVPD